MSDRTLCIFPLGGFEPLVEMLATMVASALTASKSETPPELRSTGSREKRWPYRPSIHSHRTQSATIT